MPTPSTVQHFRVNANNTLGTPFDLQLPLLDAQTMFDLQRSLGQHCWFSGGFVCYSLNGLRAGPCAVSSRCSSCFLVVCRTAEQLMHEFFRLGREERGKKLTEAKQQRRRIDSRERMFRQKLEDRFVEQTAAKAGRAKYSGKLALVFPPPRSPGTTTPLCNFDETA